MVMTRMLVLGYFRARRGVIFRPFMIQLLRSEQRKRQIKDLWNVNLSKNILAAPILGLQGCILHYGDANINHNKT
jgi:hypothetical protein